MALELSTIVQRSVTATADGQALFIRSDGSLSEKRGLNILQRAFSPGAKAAENKATVEQLRESVRNHPVYGRLLEDRDISLFFSRKLETGSVLTAGDVKMLRQRLDFALARSTGADLVASGALPAGRGTEFAWFAMQRGLPLTAEAEQKAALKAYYIEKFCEDTVKAACARGGIPARDTEAAAGLLLRSGEYRAALDGVFGENLAQLRQEGILNALRQSVEPAILVLAELCAPPVSLAGIVSAIAMEDGALGPADFDGLLALSRSGVIPDMELKEFVLFCNREGRGLATPEERGNAVRGFRLNVDAVPLAIAAATQAGLPEEVGGALAHLPELVSEAKRFLADLTPPPAIPGREQVAEAVRRSQTAFLQQKAGVIREFLALAGQVPAAGSFLAGLSEAPTEQSLCRMLPALLTGGELLNILLNPAAGADSATIAALERFTQGLQSCAHMFRGEFGTDDVLRLHKDSLCVLMHCKGVTPDQAAIMGRTAIKTLRPIGLSLGSLGSQIIGGALRGPGTQALHAACSGMHNTIRLTGTLVYNLLSSDQKTTLGIADAQAFAESFDLLPETGGYIPARDIHQSVRDVAAAHGVAMPFRGYLENSATGEAEVAAWFGPPEAPAVTALFIQEVQALCAEVGLTGDKAVALAELNADALGSVASRALMDADKTRRMTPAEARDILRQALREELRAVKAAVDHVDSLPVVGQVDEDSPPNAVTAREKRLLRSAVAGYELRTPAVIEESAKLARRMGRELASLPPDLTPQTMVKPFLDMARLYIGTMQGLDVGERDEAEKFRALPVALMMAVRSGALSAEAGTALHAALSGEPGKNLGGAFVTFSDLCLQQRGLPLQNAALSNGMQIMNLLRHELAKKQGTAGDFDPMFYTSQQPSPADIPGEVCDRCLSIVPNRALVFPGVTALSHVRPRLTQEEWNALTPVMHMATAGMERAVRECEALQRCLAANARELLAAIRAKGDAPLTPEDMWRVIMGENAPAALGPRNAGALLYHSMRQRLASLARVAFPDIEGPVLENKSEDALGSGISFAALRRLLQPGGKLTLDDCQACPLGLPALTEVHPGNAFGLTTDFMRREASIRELPPTITITRADGSGSVIPNVGITPETNTPDNPVFQKIIALCHNVCRTDAQFRRVMQSLSQASTANFRSLSRKIPGFSLSEHNYYTMDVAPQADGNVVVTIASDPGRPEQARMRITVTPAGDGTITALELSGT